MTNLFRVFAGCLLFLLGMLCCISAFYWVYKLESLPYPQSVRVTLGYSFAFGIHMATGYCFFRALGEIWKREDT